MNGEIRNQIEELCDEGLEATSYAEIDDAEQAFRDILKIVSDDAPQSAAEPRPNDEPYYIRTDCPDCSEDLVLNDELVGSNEIWHDEWICPDCQGDLYLDIPESEKRAIKEEA